MNPEAKHFHDRQQVALVLATHMSRGKTEEKAKIQNKKGKFSTLDRAGILFQAKFRSGLNKEERVEMYREAGYSDDEILSITGKKLVGTAAANIALGVSAWAGLGAITKYDNVLPMLNQIPSSAALALASIGVYTASYVINTEQNLRLTKNIGASMNTYVTGLYALGNRLLPEKVRDGIARGFPIGLDTFLRAGLYSSAIAVGTGDAHKVIMGNLFGAALNTIYIAGCEGVLRWKKRKN